jgi:opacity protein-like surface antigen
MHRLIISSVAAAAALTAAAAAFAQPAPAPAVVEEPARGWLVQAGYEGFTMRDVSRNQRPPDASPISWRGEGPAISGRYHISGRRSAHLFGLGFASARDFAYIAPTRTVDAMAGDTASRFDGRYEYRRYFWRDVGANGFDIAIGAQGIGSHVSLDRHITTALATKSRMSGGGGAGVIALRVQRWALVQFDVSWANGAIVSSRSTEHTGAPEVRETTSGGNWLTDTTVRADWRLTRTARFAVSWRRYFEGYASSHYSYSGIWQSLNVGVVYAR